MTFEVEVKVGLTESVAALSAIGGTGTVSSDAEAAAFGIDEPTIKRMFDAAFHRPCTYCNRQDPVHGTDIYAQLHIAPVTTEYCVAGAAITGTTTSSATIASQTCDNSAGTAPVSFDPDLTAEVTNTIDSTMTPESAVALAEAVNYTVSFDGTGGSDPGDYAFEQDWAATFHRDHVNTYEMSPAAPIMVPAGSIATATMVATVGTMTIDINYVIGLSGLTVGLYDPPLDKHHVMMVDVVAGLNMLDMATQITATQTLTIVFYTDPTLQVTVS